MNKEHPILFTDSMVRAILKGRKTQTRRIVPETSSDVTHWKNFVDNIWTPHYSVCMFKNTRLPEPLPKGWNHKCRFGVPGDLLWVRETFFDVRPYRTAPIFDGVVADYIYRADYEYREIQKRSIIGCHGWKPSIFMPRQASRITLEITGLKVERLQDISEDDCRAEGCGTNDNPWKATGKTGRHPWIDTYCTLWEKINGTGSWNTNPWVWVIEFKVAKSK